MSAAEFLKRYAALGKRLHASVKAGSALRVNTLLADSSSIIRRLAAKGVSLRKIPFTKHGYWIKKTPFSLGATTEYLLGLYYLQDAAAQLPVQVLAPKPGDVVFDCCAAPGGKTTQLAQWMENKGMIVSFEKNNHRIMSLKGNLERCGATNTIVYNTDAVKITRLGVRFDKALVDAPCSGNFASDPDWLSKRTLLDVKKNNNIQKKLLGVAVRNVKKGGTIVYSTCSLEPEENEMIIDWAVNNLPVHCVPTGIDEGRPGLTNVFGRRLETHLGMTRRLWPKYNKNEGFFIAKLVKHG